jgi:hypothetical protein
MTAGPCPSAETVAAACPGTRWLGPARPRTTDRIGGRSFRVPARSPPYAAAAFVNHAALHRRIEHPAACRWPGARSRLSPACWLVYRTCRRRGCAGET